MQRLRAQYDVTLCDEPPGRDGLVQALRDYDAVCSTITDALTAEVLATTPRRARIIANFGAGVEHIDLDAAAKAGLVVTNTADAVTQPTAELALMLMLMAARRAGEGERMLRAGRWGGWSPGGQMLGAGVHGKTLGLIGFGRIGRAFAAMARSALGMRIAYYSRRRVPQEVEASLEAQHYPTLKGLLGAADVVSLHCPGGEGTRHIIRAETLAFMKPSAILVNTARGSVVDEAALAHALAQGQIAAAGLDVFEREPLTESPLMELENVVLLPHLGTATVDARTAMGMQVADNLDAWFATGKPPNRVA